MDISDLRHANDIMDGSNVMNKTISRMDVIISCGLLSIMYVIDVMDILTNDYSGYLGCYCSHRIGKFN